ncbi:MAG: domain containing protein [Frankiales bacterium]|nr:domain containing protein [Frankiales bacterium]
MDVPVSALPQATRRSWQHVSKCVAGLGAAALVVAGVGAPTGASALAVVTVDKVTICHATNSNANPYVEITPDVDSIVKKSGHDSHEGPIWDPTLKASHTTWGDIIPAFDYDKGNAVGSYPGKNMPAGAAILANHCAGIGDGDLQITKTGPSTAVQSTTGTYTLTVFNSGSSAITGLITVTDTVPVGWTVGTATGSGGLSCGAPVGQVFTCTTTTDLPPVTAAASTMKVTVGVTYTDAGSKTNQSSVGSPDDTDTTNNTASKTTNVTAAPAADLEVAKTGPSTALAGSTGTYTLTTTSSGTSPITGAISIVDTVPTGWAIGTITKPANVTCTTLLQVITCGTGDDLAVGSTIVITVDVTYGPDSTGTNSVTVGASDDTDSSNNTATKLTTITAVPAPDLRVVKSGPTTAVLGTTGSYDLTVYNSGTGDVTSTITVQDTVPDGWTINDVTAPAGFACTTALQVITCTTNQDLAPGLAVDSTMVLTVEVTYATAGSKTNTVVVGTARGGESDTSNNTASATTLVTEPDPSADVTKSNDGDGNGIFHIDEVVPTTGASVPFKLHIHNTSPYTVNVTSVTDAFTEVIPAELGTGDPVTCLPALTLAPDASGDCVFTMPGYSPANGIIKTDAATVLLTKAPPIILVDDLRPIRAAAFVAVLPSAHIVSNTSTVHTVVPTRVSTSPDLALVKTGPAAVHPGDAVPYSLVVTNTGNAAASNVTVTDALPAGLTLVSAGGTGFTCSGTAHLSCLLAGSLLPGASATVNVVTTLAAGYAASTVANVAVVNPTDGTPADNTSTAVTNVILPGPPVIQDLGVSKSGPGAAQPGDELVYTITVTNVRGTAASGFTVVDALPTGLSFSAAGGADFVCSNAGATITCVYTGSLPVGGTAQITVRALLLETFRGTDVTNTAVVTAAGSDADPTNNSGSVTTPVTLPAPISAPIAGGGGGGAQLPPAAPVPVAGGSGLPFTGSYAGALLETGVGLLLLGLLLSLVTRRRPAGTA